MTRKKKNSKEFHNKHKIRTSIYIHIHIGIFGLFENLKTIFFLLFLCPRKLNIHKKLSRKLKSINDDDECRNLMSKKLRKIKLKINKRNILMDLKKIN